MFAFLRRASAPGDSRNRSGTTHEMIVFDARRVVQAIAFHLRDEDKVDQIDPQSIQQTIDTLAQRNNQFVISADRWVNMENLQRLIWLLDQSRVLVMFKAPRSARLGLK